MQKKIGAYFFTTLLLFHFGIESIASPPCFTPSAVKGCVPFTLTLDASCGAPFSVTPNYFYDFLHDSSPAASTPSNTHIFTIPGTYRVVQFVGPTTNSFYMDILVTASPDPIFTVKSCAGSNITLTMAATSPPTSIYDNYDINWGDGSALQNVAPASATTHTFASNGFQSITVTGKFLPNAACGSKTVLPYAISTLVKPELAQLKVLKQLTLSGQIEITYDSKMGQFYKIERSTNGGAYDSVGAKANNSTFPATTFLDQNLNTQANIYQYKVSTYDGCGLILDSDPIYSIIIKATPTNALNTVTWNNDPTVNNFTLTKNTVPQNFSNTTTSFLDNTIACGSSYCYSNTASLTTLTLSGNPQKSISIDTCITAISTTIPPAPQNVNSTMNGSNAIISWTSAGSSSIIYKIYNSTNGSLLTQQTGTSYSYNLPNLSLNYCYQLEYIDLCGNPSPKSLTTCPVIVEGAISGTMLTLNWNTYSGFNVQSYAVQKIDQNGTVISETNVGQKTTFSETVNLTDPYINYRIKVIPTSGTFTNSFSNNSLFKFEAEVFVPDIFTPNGDNTNEHFVVKGRYINTYSISIFSRWGEVVYASKDILVGWDGFNNFVYAPEGAYTYKIIATDIHNKEFTKTGTVTLTR